MIVARTDRLSQSIQAEIREGVGIKELADLVDTLLGCDQLIPGVAYRSRSSTGTRWADS